MRPDSKRSLPLVYALLGMVAAVAFSSDTEALALADVHLEASAVCVGFDSYRNEGPQFALGLASVSGTAPAPCAPGNPSVDLSLTGGSVASASLRTGEISAFGTAAGAPSFTPATSVVWGNASGRLRDVVTIVGGSGSFSFNARVVLHVEGTLTGYSVVGAELNQRSTCLGTDSVLCPFASSAGPFSFDLVLDVPVSTASPSFQLATRLTAGAYNNGEADASSTASLSIILPSGFSFVSESGVLLVPEAPLASLLAGGFGSLALARRRRSASRERT